MDRNTEKIDLIKKVYSKTEYPKIIDTQFQQLGNLSVNQEIEETVTVNEFFELYNELFYDIQAYGGSNSHEYLVKTSGEYINFDQDNEIIVALRAEITQLRRDLLQAQISTAEALTGEKINLDVDNIEDADLSGTKEYNEILSTIPSTPTEDNTTNTTTF
tara:strand:- start:614 stop:1093 length:480 start_codon:yes stop_codon:yes gene_type:complete